MKSFVKLLSNPFHQLVHFNEGLYPPGRIPSRRTFLVTNAAVVSKMFDRAGLAYKDLEFLPRSVPRRLFWVRIPKVVAMGCPENLAFVDRKRFWDFFIDSSSDPKYHIVRFHVVAGTRMECLLINLFGWVPPAVSKSWSVIPRNPVED